MAIGNVMLMSPICISIGNGVCAQIMGGCFGAPVPHVRKANSARKARTLVLNGKWHPI